MNFIHPEPWFSQPSLLKSYMLDLFSWEMRHLTFNFPKEANLLEIENLNFGQSGLGLDSLELMTLSISFSRSIHLQESKLEDNLLSKNSLIEWIEIASRSLENYSERISFKTSGTTGSKKYCTHKLKLLEEEANVHALHLYDRQRILRAIPSHHIYGFIFCILLPRYLSQYEESIDIRGISPNSIISNLKSGDVIVGHPEFWKFLNESEVVFPANVVGISSSGPCPVEVGLSLLDHNLSKFIEVYGSSETAGVGWREHPLDQYQLLPFWKKSTKTEEIERVVDDRIENSYLLQDKLNWQSEKKFDVIGRSDSVIQVAGNNVSLNYVKNILIKHPLVEDAVVRLMDESEGNRLKAFIVLNPNAEAKDLNVLHDYIIRSLKPYERPKSLKFGKKLPTNDMGKLCNWSID